MPLLLGAGGLLVAVIVVIAIAMSGSSSNDDGSGLPVAGKGGDGSVPNVKPKVDPNDPATWPVARRRQHWNSSLRLKTSA